MSETSLSALPTGAETDQNARHQLRVETEVKGLPYVLEGEIPDEPNEFALVARLPDPAWEVVQPLLDEELSRNGWFSARYTQTCQSLSLGEGRVGSVWVSRGSSPDGAPTVHVDRIQTELGYIPKGTEYHGATGVGSMILDSLCALADAKGWRITLRPDARDGRLTDTDLIGWYERRGFRYGFEDEDAKREVHYPVNDMLRLPQPPDPSSPIVQALTA